MSLAEWIESTLVGGHPQRLETNQYLFFQGDTAQAVYIVISGRVRLLRHLSSGVEVSVHTALAGETLAEAALFSEVYHCDAVAAENSVVLAYSKTALWDALGNPPSLILALLENFASQIHTLRSQIELRNIRSANERVLRMLQLKARNDGVVAFDRPLKDIAQELGLTHEAFYRSLTALAADGKIMRLDERVIHLVGRGAVY